MQIISVLIYVQYKYKLVSLIEFKGFIVVLYFFPVLIKLLKLFINVSKLILRIWKDLWI